MTDDQTSKTPILTGKENFPIWRIRILAKLRKEKVAHCAEKGYTPTPGIAVTPAPTPSSPATPTVATTTPTPQATTAATPVPTTVTAVNATDREEWETLDQKAWGIIVEHISNEVIERIGIDAFTESKTLLDEIKRIYQNLNTGSERFYTFVGIMRRKWDGTSPIQDHLAAFRASRSRLSSMGKPIDEEIFAFALLESLPDDQYWENFKSTTLLALPDGKTLEFNYRGHPPR